MAHLTVEPKDTYSHLEELINSDYQLVSNEINIINWIVKSEGDAYIGKVNNLLFDPQTMAVRYLVVNLTDNGMNLDGKNVLIPIGIANIHKSNDEVVLPNIHIDQFNALPAYKVGEITAATEVYIRSVIGSPAALRIEEKVTQFDQSEFYKHHHFNKDRFYERGFSGEREQEQQTIHEMIDNSKNHNLHAAEENTGLGTHHNEHKGFTGNDDSLS